MNATASELLRQVGIEVDVNRPLAEFNIAIQQMVAIARAVSFKSQLVVMDEPTSSLDDQEVETLFSTIRRLQGKRRRRHLHLAPARRAVRHLRPGDHYARRQDRRHPGCQRDLSKLELVSRMLGRDMGEVAQRGATSFTHPDRAHRG